MLHNDLCLARYVSGKWAEWHDVRKFQGLRHSSRMPTGQDFSAMDGTDIDCRWINCSVTDSHADATAGNAHHRVHTTVYLNPGVLLWWGICVKVRGRPSACSCLSLSARMQISRQQVQCPQFSSSVSTVALQERDDEVQVLLLAFAGPAKHTPVKGRS